jgi:mannan endo-1,4-beta-mannosidase
MRWPNRKPHSLTKGMREAQAGLSRFLPLIDWNRFERRCWNERIELSSRAAFGFGCGDEGQAILWVLRRKTGADGMVDTGAQPLPLELRCPAQAGKTYKVLSFDTREGRALGEAVAVAEGERLSIRTELRTDLAFAVRALD